MLRSSISRLRRSLIRALSSKKSAQRLRVETLEGREMPAAFTLGNLVVYRVGTGDFALNGSAAAVFLDEFGPTTQNQAFTVQSLNLPTSDDQSNQTLTASGADVG